MKRYVKSNEGLSFDANEAFSEDVVTRRRLAHTTDSKELLEIYSYDPDTDVRLWVLSNPNTPSDIIARLSHMSLSSYSGPILLCEGIVSNPNSPPEALRVAFDLVGNDDSFYEDWSVLANEIIDHPNASIDFLRDVYDAYQSWGPRYDEFSDKVRRRLIELGGWNEALY